MVCTPFLGVVATPDRGTENSEHCFSRILQTYLSYTTAHPSQGVLFWMEMPRIKWAGSAPVQPCKSANNPWNSRSGWLHVGGNLVDLSALRFVVVGIGNTIVGLGVIYAGKWLLQFGDVLANLLGYACGFSMSFALNKRWTFRYQGPPGPALARFLAVLVIAYLLNLAVVVSSRDLLHCNSYLAQALGIIPYSGFGYVGSRFFAFPQVSETLEPPI